MTRRYTWAPTCASLLIVLSIFLLTITSLADTAGKRDADKVCSEGCHEARSEPRPDWHPDISDRIATSGGEGQTGKAEALLATTLDLSTSPHVTSGEPVTLTATLRDAHGAPVPRAEIRFLLDAEFAGAEGQMEIGAARTDANGVTELTFVPTVAQAEQVISVRFEGKGDYKASEGQTAVTSVWAPPPAYHVAPIGLEAVGRWTLAAFLAAILGVWGAFGFVVYQGYAIWREG